MSSAPLRLAVLGSPIAHSKSPALHVAAYQALGLAWSYESVELGQGELAGFVASRDAGWRGLSITMPLKREALALLDEADDLVSRTGSANTVVFDERDGERWIRGFNTDVYGIEQALRRAGRDRLGFVQILGNGATAASAIAAAARLDASRVVVSARAPEKARFLADIGAQLGIDVVINGLADASRVDGIPDAIISTLPGAAEADIAFSEETRRHSVLFDVAYSPWPSTFGSSWYGVGGTVISGLEMLVLQALVQVRIFSTGDAELPLPREDEVLGAMRASVGLQ